MISGSTESLVINRPIGNGLRTHGIKQRVDVCLSDVEAIAEAIPEIVKNGTQLDSKEEI